MKNKSVKLLLYCTKAKPKLMDFKGYILNGKIVAEADCDLVEKFDCCCVPYRNKNNLGYECFIDNGVYKVDWEKGINLVDEEDKYNNPDDYKDDGVVFERKDHYIDTMFKNEDFQKMCLTPQKLLDYITLGNNGYAIHLKNVKPFKKPKKLSEYYKDNFIQAFSFEDTRVHKAPQNMMYCYDEKGDLCVLISIHSQWLYKILNGEKTIEVRKSILKVLKELDR